MEDPGAAASEGASEARDTAWPRTLRRGAMEGVADPAARKVDRFLRVSRSTLRFAVAGVLLFLLLFVMAGKVWLAALAAASLPAYLVALRRALVGGVDAPLAIGAAVVVVDAVVDTVVLGLPAGFLVYLPVLTIVLFMHPRASLRVKVLWSSVVAAVPVGLITVVELVRPLAPVGRGATDAFAILNALFVMALLAYLAYVVIEAADAAERELRDALGRLAEVARTDVLTGLLNRRAMLEWLDAEASRAKRKGGTFAVVVADIDGFKQVNDEHGHALGDRALQVVAACLQGTIRREDRVARWGGEEFLVLLRDADLGSGAAAAARLRVALAAAEPIEDATGLRVTATFGVAAYRPGTKAEEVVRAADRALYEGKASGKDCVALARG